MTEQSHREAMSAAIRAQRERHAVPRSIAPEPAAQPVPVRPPPPDAAPIHPKRKSLLARLFGK